MGGCWFLLRLPLILPHIPPPIPLSASEQSGLVGARAQDALAMVAEEMRAMGEGKPEVSLDIFRASENCSLDVYLLPFPPQAPPSPL